MYKDTIGIIGGFGGYASVDFFKRIIDAFSSDNERNLPHIIMECDFTMPSRTRALLYGESYEEIVAQIAASVRKVMEMGANHIILVCGTAHAFLPDVYNAVPDAEGKVINIITELNKKMESEHIEKALILAAEGTLKKKIYENELGIQCVSPQENKYKDIRKFIESVKQNQITENVLYEFNVFLDSFKCKNIVLGCTEFPVLVNRLELYKKDKGKDLYKEYTFWDPLEITLQTLVSIIQ